MPPASLDWVAASSPSAPSRTAAGTVRAPARPTATRVRTERDRRPPVGKVVAEEEGDLRADRRQHRQHDEPAHRARGGGDPSRSTSRSRSSPVQAARRRRVRAPARRTSGRTRARRAGTRARTRQRSHRRQSGAACCGRVRALHRPGPARGRAGSGGGAAPEPQLHRHRAHPPRPDPRGRGCGREGTRVARDLPRRRAARGDRDHRRGPRRLRRAHPVHASLQEGARAVATGSVGARSQLHRHRAHPPRPHAGGRRSRCAGARADGRRPSASSCSGARDRRRAPRERGRRDVPARVRDRGPRACRPRWRSDHTVQAVVRRQRSGAASKSRRDDPRNRRRPDGRPDARIVLLRGVDERGFVWFTNRNSPKGRELGHEPSCSPGLRVAAAAPSGPRDRHRDPDRRRGVGRRTSRRAPVGASSARGRRSRARCSPDASDLDEARRGDRRALRDGSVPGPRTGAAIGSRTRRSRCGRAAPTGCTTASASAVPPTAGRSNGSGPRPQRPRPKSTRPRPGPRSAPRCAARGPGLPSPSRSGCAPHPRRQLELHAAAAGQVHRVLGVQAPQRRRDRVEVVDDRRSRAAPARRCRATWSASSRL